MLPDIESIKMRRKILGITQKDLARHTETSQSFIAKLESGRINPSYRHMKKILDFIESLEIRESEELRANEVYRKNVLSVSVGDRIPAVVRLMKKHGISQLPVFRDNVPAGSITEMSIVDLMSRGYDSKKLSVMRVSDIMGEPFPTISQNTPISVISSILQHNAAVLLTKDGGVTGIITKADIIKVIK